MWRHLFPLIKIRNSLSVSSSNLKPINIKTPFQKADLGDCGIACAYMIIKKTNNPLPFKKFIKKYKNQENYLQDIGWKHQGLINILGDHNIKAAKKKYQTTNSLIKTLQKTKRPVIVSVLVPSPQNLSNNFLFKKKDSTKPLEKHMILAIGFKENCLITHDPRNIGQYKQNLKIPLQTFKNIFTGNYIYTHG